MPGSGAPAVDTASILAAALRNQIQFF